MKIFNFSVSPVRCILFVFLTLSSHISNSQSNIAFQGFESDNDWSVLNGSGLISSEIGSSDTPLNARVKTGTNSWQVNNQEAVLELESIDVRSYQNVFISISLSSTSTSSRNGADGTDYVHVFVDQGSGYPDQPDLSLVGRSNAKWDYVASLTATAIAGQPQEFAAPQGGDNSNNYAILQVQIPDDCSLIKLKVLVFNNDESEFWNLDDITLIGELSGNENDEAQASILSNPSCLTEVNLNNASLTISLSNEAFVSQLSNSGFTLLGVPDGVVINNIERINDTEVQLTMGFDGTDFDENYSSFVVRCEAISLVGDEGLNTNTMLIEAVKELTGDTPAVFFSEYIEGSGYNKALEIFNGTENHLDLEGYIIRKARNGEGWGDELALSGSVSRDDVYVVFVNDSRVDSVICDVEGDESHAVSNFNGDDAIGLFFHEQLIDVIGNPNEDPGAAWVVGETSSATVGHTLVRKNQINFGNPGFWTDQGNGSAVSEWEVYDEDDFTNLGFHRNTKVWSGKVDADWHQSANWGGGLPVEEQKAFVPRGLDTYPILTEAFILNDLEIDSEASLLGNSFLTVKGTCSVFRDLSKGKWQYFGIPVQSALSAVAITQAGTFLVDYDNNKSRIDEAEDDAGWTFITDEDVVLDPAKGYGILVEEAATLRFDGILNSGDQLVDLSIGENNWALIANPFVSALDWSQLCVNSVITGTAYLWEPDLYADSNYGSYILINPDGVISGNGNQYIEPVIPPMQGFFVDIAQDGEFCFQEQARVNNNQSFLKSESVFENFVRLNISYPNGVDELVMYNKAGASLGYDLYMDSRKMQNKTDESVEIYSLADGEKLAIDVQGEELFSRKINISSSQPKEIEFSIGEMINVSDELKVILIDKLDQTEHELTTEKRYSAQVEDGENANRFELKIGELSTSIHQLKKENLFYLKDRKLYYTGTVTQFNLVKIYDLYGRKLIQATDIFKNGQLEMRLAPAIYLLYAEIDGQVITQKILVQ